ncbi:putative ribonuclease H-like domain-containing protein [Tanacetum coccineum]
MTGNKCYLDEYEDYDGGFVSFGDGKGRISRKCKIKTGSLDFNDLLDESQVLLRVPRKDNIYSVDLKSIVPTGGKFDGKVDEGYFVTYSMVSKAMRVFNKRIKIVEDTLNIRFLENTTNVKGNGPDWLFDVDSLSISMNYVPIDAGNKTNGIARIIDNIVAGPKDCEGDAGMKLTKVDENKASDKSRKHDQEARSYTPVSTVEPSFNTVVPSTLVNTAGPFVSTVIGYEEQLFERFSPFKNAFTLPHIPNVSSMDNTGIFGNAYDDEDLEEEVDINNVISSYLVLGTSFTKFHKDHPEDQVIGSLKTLDHTQEEGIDYDEVFAPVARTESIRLFLAYASDKDNKHLFGRGQIDKTLFIKRHKDDILLVQVYVDDIIFGSTKKQMSNEFETLMHDKFQMSSMGELSFFLGLQVKQKSDEIFISQDKYVAEILKKFDFVSVKTASTPMETNKALIKDEEAEDVDVHLYRFLIGSLMYLTASRPDIMFAVCACARDSPFDLEAFSDSDYAGASLDRKSTTGGCQFLGKRLISWQCKKQTIVANSTTEAEYVAAANCCGQVLWIQNQMLDFGFNFMNTKIYIDNESTICIVKNLVFHSKTKHIEIRYHFIRDSYEKKLIQVIKIHTYQNVVDLLTKAFDASRFNFLIASIGIGSG